MALAILFILNVVILILALVLQYFLYREDRPLIFWANGSYIMVLAYLVVSSLASNYRWERLVGGLWGLLALGLSLLRFRGPSRILRWSLSLLLIGGLVQYLIF